MKPGKRVVIPCVCLSLAIIAGLSLLRGARVGRPGYLVAPEPERIWKAPEAPARDRPSAARFAIHNPGETTVRILSIDKSCGCATPEVKPSVLQPGSTGVVEVRAEPPAVGERAVTITLYTDSPLTPTLPLQLRVVSGRQPPFLFDIKGDLAFDADGGEREVTITTVEPAWRTASPILDSDLEQLRFELGEVKDQPYGQTEYVLRSYTYRARFDPSPPQGSFSGLVTVTDPWEPNRTRRLHVFGRAIPTVRVLPSPIVLDLSDPARDVGSMFVILTKDAYPDLRAEPEAAPGELSPLIVERRGPSRSARSAQFAVRPRPGIDVREGAYTLRIRGDSSGLDLSTVTLIVKSGARP